MLALLIAGCATPSTEVDPRPIPSTTTPIAPDQNPPNGLPILRLPSQATRVSDGGEPLILADRNGKYLWIADTSGVYYSTDNGSRWQRMIGYTGDFALGFTDGPGLAQDEQGRLYKASLHDNRLDVARSDDGVRFNQVSYVAGYPVDRPWIAVRGQTVVVVYLNNFGAVGTQEACTRSTDAGATFPDRNPIAGDHGTGGLHMAPDGSFYFTAQDGSITRHAATCADANSFTAENRPMFSGGLGVKNLIALAGNENRLFVPAAGPGNKMQVSGVQKWGDRPRVYTVSPPELATNTFGTAAARGDDVAVAWYGSTARGDPSAEGFRGSFDVYVALIRDYFGLNGEPTIQLWKVSEKPNHNGQICMGGVTCTGARGLLDYFGVAFDPQGAIHVAYVDDTAGTTTYHARILPDGPGTPLDGAPTGLPTNMPGSGTVGPSTGLSGAAPVARMKGAVFGLRLDMDASESTGTPPLTYSWDLGDGTTLQGVTINHTYAAAGEYLVQLVVRDPQGRDNAARTTITVAPGGSAAVGQEGGRGSNAPAALLVFFALLCALGIARSRPRP